MKKIIIFITILMVTVSAGAEVKVIENPETPQGKNAGRVIVLEEVMRISDESGDFFFKHPGRIKIAPDESIFLTDKDQFLRFDKNGKFLNNQQKKGEGPGEYTYMSSYQFSGDKIFIFASRPQKIIETDMKGNLLKESRMQQQIRFRQVFGFIGDKFWFVTSSFREILKENTGVVNLGQELAWGTRGGKSEKTGLVFFEMMYMEKDTSKGGMRVSVRDLARPIFAWDRAKNLYVSDAQKYLVHQVDLEKVKIIRTFSRKYNSVPYKDERSKEEKEKRKLIGNNLEYFADIQGLLTRGDKIWVKTSTFSKEKGVLIDVFSREGKYLDNFYLQLPRLKKVSQLGGGTFILYKDFLFTVESDEDGNIEVVKYKFKI